MHSKSWLLTIFLLLSLLAAPGLGLSAPPEIKYIDPATLKAMMGAPDVIIIDVSRGWWTYDQKIVGSLVHPEETETWAAGLPKAKKIVLYCG